MSRCRWKACNCSDRPVRACPESTSVDRVRSLDRTFMWPSVACPVSRLPPLDMEGDGCLLRPAPGTRHPSRGRYSLLMTTFSPSGIHSSVSSTYVDNRASGWPLSFTPIGGPVEHPVPQESCDS